MKILVTGGSGFIGSHFIRYLLTHYSEYSVINLDKLTYAGNVENLRDVAQDSRYQFVSGDICDRALVRDVVQGVDVIVNLAAETHVDRAIVAADDFVRTDIVGTFTLLDIGKEVRVPRFIQCSTDEVYGSIECGAFKETDRLVPSNPYSASKAGGDLLTLAYWKTYRLPVVVTRSSNNFGPYQHPEKLIPRFITNALQDVPLPLFGEGRNVRDWLYVLDHCQAIDLILHKGREGEVYNVGGSVELDNLTLTRKILAFLGKPESLIQYVDDRPGHDWRYALDSAKIYALGWRPRYDFEKAVRTTVEWYRANEAWWRPLLKDRK